MRSTLFHALVVAACTLAASREVVGGQKAMLFSLTITVTEMEYWLRKTGVKGVTHLPPKVRLWTKKR